MHRARPRQLGIAQRLLGVGPETDFVTAELVADAQIADARQPGIDARLGKALGREKAVRFQPFEHRFNLRFHMRSGSVIAYGWLGYRQPGMSKELPAQLEPAVLTLGKPLQRARLQ